MSHFSCSAKADLPLSQRVPLPVFCSISGCKFGVSQGEGHFGALSLYSELEVEQGLLLPLPNKIFCLALLQRTSGRPASTLQ